MCRTRRAFAWGCVTGAAATLAAILTLHLVLIRRARARSPYERDER